MNIKITAFWGFACILLNVNSYSGECELVKSSYGIAKVDNAIVFASANFNVDADGAPNAYRVDGTGLSYTCDGVVAIQNGKRITPSNDKANWQSKCNAAWKLAKETNDYSKVAIFGFQTDKKNQPLIQGKGDPFPDQAYISTTSVQIPNAPSNTQLRQVDSTKIPYVVIPSNVIRKFDIKPADIAVIYRPSTERIAFAIYADQGGLGEGSVKLHYELGSDPMINRGKVERAKRRIEDKVITFLFPGKSTERTIETSAWLKQIEEMGKLELEDFGGLEKLKSCASKL
jgi:hypothetical protein